MAPRIGDSTAAMAELHRSSVGIVKRRLASFSAIGFAATLTKKSENGHTTTVMKAELAQSWPPR